MTARELLMVKERICACLGGTQAVDALPGGVDERTGSGMLGRDTEVAGVAEGVLPFSSGKEGVESRVLGVLVFLREALLLLRLWLNGGLVV